MIRVVLNCLILFHGISCWNSLLVSTRRKICLPRKLRIIGGSRVLIYGYPSICSIIEKQHPNHPTEQFRGATVIISQFWTVTAAHCIQFIPENVRDYVFVRGNVSNRLYQVDDQIDHKIELFLIHSEYNNDTKDNDISLLKVVEPFCGKFELPIPLPRETFKYRTVNAAYVAGWGATSSDDMATAANQLRSATVYLYDQETCNKPFHGQITENMVCASNVKRHADACNFDSGGPLVQNGTLIGIVSWGNSCAMTDFPGVYVKLSRYEKWIQDHDKIYRIGATFRNSF